ncbi:MAG: PEP/pyruvate-binding domain-containing protein [Gemmataceae bacterium]
MPADIRNFDDITPDDRDVVGGKGLSLGLLARAGLPVPPGFCVTSDAYRRRNGDTLPPALQAIIVESYRNLGSGPVAVRSSATAEDGSVASFAGQQETYLGVVGDEPVCSAIIRCWNSLQSERAKAYRHRQGVAVMAMAVVVQRLVPAETAGVLFTRDPLHPDSGRMIVEASWGLGETVVSGRVTPDRFTLDAATGRVIERHLGRKTVERLADGEREVSAERQREFCLNDSQLAELARLGRTVEQYYGEPRDVEWAWADGQAWLLQARPITAAGASEREAIRLEEVAALRTKAEPAGTVWGRFNLSEILPEPTPMTWAVVRRFMSGRGGYGRMFADLGFPPDRALGDECVYDLVCGRPYMNLSREPRMQWGSLPFAHSFAELKNDPAKVPYSAAALQPERCSFLGKFFAAWRVSRGMERFHTLSLKFAEPFRTKTVPEFVAETSRAAAEDWSPLDPPALLQKLDYWIDRTLVGFARDSLKATAFAAGSLARLQQLLEKRMPAERAKLAVGALTLGIHPDPDADLPKALRELAAGDMSRDAFLVAFGHRGPNEMELSQPRWNEDPAAVARLQAAARAGGALNSGEDALDRLAAEAKLHPYLKLILRGELARLRQFVALRETGKHHLMRGYALIRRALVELDCRFGLAGGIFFLTPDHFPKLLAGADVSGLIAERRKRRSVALSLEAPAALFSDDLEAIGRPLPPPEGADLLTGVPLSAGVAEGPALVLTDPTADVPIAEGYILVCPSTDPSWVPLFARAKGLVMETGGVLSHGAIVAREFGLPAVAGLPDATRRLRTGQRLRVDGGGGTVTITPLPV